MAKIRIDINEGDSVFYLTGDIKSLAGNRRAHFYLKDSLEADFADTEKLSIPFLSEGKEKTLADIRDVLEKFGFEEERSETVSKVLKDFFDDEEKFDEFSKKAEAIRNNECDPVEFRKFTESLKTNLTARTLYPLQLLSAYHLAFAQNACNFSVPGAGKTSIVYGAYAYLKNLPPDNPKRVDKLLIIGPLSSFGPWEEEYESCFGSEPISKRLSGGGINQSEKTKYFYASNPPEITLISYQGAASNAEDIIFFLKKFRVMVVLDEAHKIKNTDGGMWAEAIGKIAKYCKSRVILTGTPMPNGFEDLYNLFNFIYPDKDLIKFHLFQLKDMRYNRHDARVPQLIKNISPLFIRIKKSDLGLPKPIEYPPHIVPMGPLQREIYDYISQSYRGYLQRAEKDNFAGVKGLLAKARLIRLMQASTNPALLQKPIDEYYEEQGLSDDLFIDDTEILEKIRDYSKSEILSKFVETAKIAREIIDSGGKVIIWTVFIKNILDLQAYLESLSIRTKLLYGATPIESDDLEEGVETRESIIREFHNPQSSFKVIIANPFAVSESISLHKACHNAIYLERTHNASQFLQSKDRIHRFGLKPDDVISYHYILSEESIDQSIHNLLLEKEKRMLEVIEKEPIPLINMNVDFEEDTNSDLKAIIRDYVGRTSQA